MSGRIAIVGISCRYPDATTAEQLWENALAGRRAFRRLPDERMNQADYYSPDPTAPDRFYSSKAAVIKDYEFDRLKFRIAGSTFRSTDMTHWLALDIAAQALADAGFPDGDGLPKTSTGVIVGNSLTGEFSRASLMRLRWPYVQNVVGAALREQGWDDDRLAPFLQALEAQYKSPFAPIDEDTLAGGLSNTIAGRICNHFDLRGGGYTVDGACSSSLLSVATACRALVSGELDVAIAGGVDLSIDPFEVIGFAKTGALATGEMRVYDRGSNGFWPGEGCGMVVLMRAEDALLQDRPAYALIAGWGVSSDGKGGITRPEASGHQLALQRAYALAGFGVETVSLFEGHGTGTAVGDATELRALSNARRDADPHADPAAISTIKGNIGHTKAAAGIAGVIKATLAVTHRLIPPATGHIDPHPELLAANAALRVPMTIEAWPADRPVRVGVSSMGFGGINTHIVLEAPNAEAARASATPIAVARRVSASRQDAELLMLDADSIVELPVRVGQIAAAAGRLSYAELGDLAATLQAELKDRPVRAAVVCASPEEAQGRLHRLLDLITAGATMATDITEGVFLGRAGRPPRIGFLFPGQGSGRTSDGGLLRRRFPIVDALYQDVAPSQSADQIATEVAQPRIATASVAGLRLLAALGITAASAAGHSLGELTALHWAGAMDEATLLRIVAARGRIMAHASHAGGTMASIAAGPDDVTPLLVDSAAVIAGYNSPRQTVVSGSIEDVERVGRAAADRGLAVTRLPVSHAFHSPLVGPAAEGFAEFLATAEFTPLTGAVMSTVTGDSLPADVDIRELLRTQVLEPVRFSNACRQVADAADLVIEVGPGHVLTRLAGEIAPGTPAVSLDCGGPSLGGLLRAVGAAYVLGAPVDHAALFEGRFTREFHIENEMRFFASPCERAPHFQVGPAVTAAHQPEAESTVSASRPGEDTLTLLLRLAAERAELPGSLVSPDSLPLDELHLSSITVGQVMNEAARMLGLPPPEVATNFATSTLRELAAALDELAATGLASDAVGTENINGVSDWVRAFTIDWTPDGRPASAVVAGRPGDWTVVASADHAWAEPVRRALDEAELGGGVLLCLRENCDQSDVETILEAAHAALRIAGPTRLVVLQHGTGATAFAKSLHLEAPSVATCVIDVPVAKAPTAAQIANVVADVAATPAFSEIRYDGTGERLVPLLNPVPRPAAPAAQTPLGEQDLVLVTGGGKGITAECALAIALDSGARLGLLGRADPATDAELAANLERMTAAGVMFRYVRADVTSPDDTAAAVADLQKEFGPVTAILHGAGRNEPRSLASLDADTFRRTLAPKLDGLRSVLAAVDLDRLRLLLTFGSIIGRAGLRGEADYATANDWLTAMAVDVGRARPHIRTVAMEWSVWSGAGMGERLGVVESLIREGVTPITTDRGIQALREILADPSAAGPLVIMSRAQGLPTIRSAPAELPLLRFIDRPRVWYPGVELVADADLSSATDPYLDDHLLDGVMLFPAVIGMEAMAEAAAAVSGHGSPPMLENVEFLRPIVIQPGGSTMIRLAVVVVDVDTVDAVIRSGETGFEADHFRARLRYGVPDVQGAQVADDDLPPVPVDPLRELYGGMLFQGKRFQRLIRYRSLASQSCQAEIAVTAGTSWFGTFLPQETLLGDPGARDAFMHSIQSCVPDATLLPVGIERLYPFTRPAGDSRVTMYANERSRTGDTYLYDVDVFDDSGVLVERWVGMRLQAVRKQDARGPWAPALLGPYLERQLIDSAAMPPVSVVVETGRSEAEGRLTRREQTTLALRRMLGSTASIRHRPDGKPEAAGHAVSSSHGGGVTLAVVGANPLGCDVQPVPPDVGTDWDALLGVQSRLAAVVAAETGEPLAVASTRVWSVIESMRKSGRSIIGHPTLDRHGPAGWVTFALGDLRIATFVTSLSTVDGDVVFAVLSHRRG